MLIAAITALAAWTMSPAQLPQLGSWSEVTLPGAPFRVDLPAQLKLEADRVTSGVRTRTWSGSHGLMTIEISYVDRPGPTGFSARSNLEALGAGLLKQWKNATASVSDMRVAGHIAAKLEIEHDVERGRIRVEHVAMRVGEDDWTVQTTRFVGRDGEVESAHILRSLQAPSPMPALAPAAIGRLTVKAFGKPVVTNATLPDASPYAQWTTHAFDYDGKTKAWIFQLRMKPGQILSIEEHMQAEIDNVVQQSNPKPRINAFPDMIAGYPAMTATGQTITAEGEECFRIVVLGEGQEGWVMLMAGPNTARSQMLYRDMITSIQVRR